MGIRYNQYEHFSPEQWEIFEAIGLFSRWQPHVVDMARMVLVDFSSQVEAAKKHGARKQVAYRACVQAQKSINRVCVWNIPLPIGKIKRMLKNGGSCIDDQYWSIDATALYVSRCLISDQEYSS